MVNGESPILTRAIERRIGRPIFDIRDVSGSIARQREFERTGVIPPKTVIRVSRITRAGPGVSQPVQPVAVKPAAVPEERDLTVVLPPTPAPVPKPLAAVPARAEPRFGVGREAVGLKPLPEFRPVQREPFEFTPAGFVRFVERRVSPFIPTTREAAVTELLAETLVRPSPAIRRVTRPGTVVAEAALAPGAFLFRGGAEALVSEAERIKRRTFRLDVPVTRPVGRIISPLLGAPPGVVLERVPIRREEIGVAAEFAGELATLAAFEAFAASPKALRQGREALSIGERGGIQIIEKKGRKIKFVKGRVEVKLRPRQVKEFERALKESIKEAKVAAPPVAPGEFRIELPTRLTKGLARELQKSAEKAIIIKKIKPFKPVKPPKVTGLEKPAVEELARVFGKRTIQIQKVKPPTVKLAPVITKPKPVREVVSFFKVPKPTKAEAESIRFLQTQIREALKTQAKLRAPTKLKIKPVRIRPIIPVRDVAETQQLIPGAASALGLKAGKRLELKKKPVFEDLELVSRPVAPIEAERVRPLQFIGVAPRPIRAVVPRERFKPEEKLGIRVTPVVVPRVRAIPRVAEIPGIKAVDITKVKVPEVLKIRVPTVERIRPREIERFRTPVFPRIRIPDITRVERPRVPVERVPKELRRRVPRLPPLQLPRLPKPRPLTREERRFGFALEVRRRGKFVPAFPGKIFTERTAKQLAQQLVGGTPLAAFRVRRVAGVPVKVVGLPEFKAFQFRRPVKKGVPQVASAIFIEKTKFRIDQPGEFKGITLKGLEALRLQPEKRKRKKKRKGKARKKGKRRKTKRRKK